MSAFRLGPLYVDHTAQGGYHLARAHFRTPEGDVWIVARAHEGAIRYLLPHAATALPPAQIGNIFDDIAKGVKKIARSKVLRQVMSTAASVVSHPAFSAVASIVPGVGPGIAAAGQFAGHAAKLALKATAGSPKARQRIVRMAKDAARGVPQARREYAAYKGIVAAHEAAKKAGPRQQAAFEQALQQAARAPASPPVAFRLAPLDLAPSGDDPDTYELPEGAEPVDDVMEGMVLGYTGCV